MKKVLLGLGLAILLSACGTGNEPVAEDAVQEPTVDTTAENILNAYNRNEVAADQEYTGRNIRVAGIVTEISSAYDNSAQVSLGDNGSYKTVQAFGDEAFNAKAARLTKGQNVSMTCVGNGEVIGMPMLNECVIH